MLINPNERSATKAQMRYLSPLPYLGSKVEMSLWKDMGMNAMSKPMIKSVKITRGFLCAVPCAESLLFNIELNWTVSPYVECTDPWHYLPSSSGVKWSAMQCSAVQCSAVQCSAVQCSAVQCSAMQCNGSKWLQLALNGHKWLQIALNGSKWHQMAPNSSKLLQIATYGLKWLIMGPKAPKWFKIASNNSKKLKISQSNSK